MKCVLASFSGSGGKTALVALAAAAGVVTFLGLAVAGFWRSGGPFDSAGFAAGWGLTLGASAAAIAGHAWGAARADAIASAPANSAPSPTSAAGA